MGSFLVWERGFDNKYGHISKELESLLNKNLSCKTFMWFLLKLCLMKPN